MKIREFHYFNIFVSSYSPVLSFRKIFVCVLIIRVCNVLGIGLINYDFICHILILSEFFIVNQHAD